MSTLVLKFGGASVQSPKHIDAIADIIIERKKLHKTIAVVVSAMGNTTNDLLALASQVHPNPPRREQDMLVSVGERISMALLAMALSKKGCDAVSFTGSQTGIITCENHTDARIVDVRPHRILPHLNEGKVVIVAGFQGVSRLGNITTLGRGGSDTSAVALAIAINSDRVEFYKDVLGVYNEDPKKSPSAQLYDRLNYKQAVDIMVRGAKVLNPRCIVLAEKNGIKLYVRSFLEEAKEQMGTLIEDTAQMKPESPLFELGV